MLEQLVAAAGAVVTMTGTARDRLLVGYAVDAAKVSVIPHGAADHAGALAEPRPRPHLLTWGLLGPGKGIEWALRAVARLRDFRPAVTYTVAGRTHPKVRERHGEALPARRRTVLTNGPGLLVPHRDPAAAGIRRILTDPGGLALSSHSRPPALLWPAVAARYETLAERLRSAGSPVSATVARA
ncbi:hypothetical protein [Dactylosporangium roseum]|uniref:hypothetical protein n=1 Tax=Dactylosporangium roseum TaxID=47989 RepID=UPI0021B20A9F|nr:hypothetical protein [Dactylosporangium roseum]